MFSAASETSQLTVVTSPAHSLHHVCDEAVRDARTGLFSEVEGVLQLLNGSYAAAARPPLLLQLVVEEINMIRKNILYVVQWIVSNFNQIIFPQSRISTVLL